MTQHQNLLISLMKMQGTFMEKFFLEQVLKIYLENLERYISIATE